MMQHDSFTHTLINIIENINWARLFLGSFSVGIGCAAGYWLMNKLYNRRMFHLVRDYDRVLRDLKRARQTTALLIICMRQIGAMPEELIRQHFGSFVRFCEENEIEIVIGREDVSFRAKMLRA